MQTIISIKNLSKIYPNDYKAIDDLSLDIKKGEIIALLGPNGAGKTTLISTTCGTVSPTSGQISVAGYDIITEYRKTRKLIGLVPQELTLGAFDTVWNTINFSRGLFGKSKNHRYLDKLLKDLTLFDKKHSELMTLSGGMKRRVLIAKALAHEPSILFLDEPTAGVDVELRKDMWRLVDQLRETGVTIALTTHYIEEAQAIADRVGVINKGKLLLLDEKKTIMRELGKKHLEIELKEKISSIPNSLREFELELQSDGLSLIYTYDTQANRTGIMHLLKSIGNAGLSLKDLNTSQTSLEEIFVNLVSINEH